jgi:hypothetical protein
MRMFRRLLVLVVSLSAAGGLSAPAAFATRSVWARGGQPTCTVDVTALSSSSTTCTGTMGGENGMQFLVNVDVSGVAVYECEDSTGATVPGQNQVQAQGGSATSFTPTKKDPTFVTDPAVLAAAPAPSASQAGCADGTTPVDPTLTTTKVQLWIATQGDAPLLHLLRLRP